MIKSKLSKSLSGRAVIVTLSSIFVNAVTLFTAPVFTRLLSTKDYGSYSVFMSWVKILAIIWGLQTYGSLNNGKIVYDENKYKKYCADTYNLSLLAFGIGLVATYMLKRILAQLLGVQESIVILLILVACGYYSMLFLSTFLNIEKMVFQGLFLSLTFVLSSTFLSIVLIKNDIIGGYQGRIIGNMIPYACIISFCFLFFNTRCLKKKEAFFLDSWRFCLNLSLPLIMHGLSTVVIDQSDRIMLKWMNGEAIAGIYSFCYTAALPVSIVYGSLNSIWVPQYYAYMAEKNDGPILEHHQKYMFLVISITCGYILVSPEIVKILTTSEYWEGIKILPLIIAGYFFNFLYLFPANYEFFFKKTKYVASATVISGIVNIILNTILIPYFGMMGAAISTIVSFIVMFIIHEYVARFILKGYAVKPQFYFRGIITVVMCILLFYTIKEYWLIRWGLGSILGIILVKRIIKQGALL